MCVLPHGHAYIQPVCSTQADSAWLVIQILTETGDLKDEKSRLILVVEDVY